MNISITQNTIRYEDENGSHSWPLYMDSPVSHPIISALTIQQSPVPVRFDSDTCTIQAGSDKITPETDLSAYPEEVKVFAQTIYSSDPNAEGEGYYAELYRLMNMEDEEDVPLTKKEMQPVIKEIDGKLRRVMEEVDVPDMEPDQDVWNEDGTEIIGKMPGKQKVRKGKRVPDSVKERLNTLRSKANGR